MSQTAELVSQTAELASMRRPLAVWVALLGAAGGLEDYRADDWDGSPVVYTGELKMPPERLAFFLLPVAVETETRAACATMRAAFAAVR